MMSQHYVRIKTESSLPVSLSHTHTSPLYRDSSQGDPPSPQLFNLAFEPLLPGINHTIAGYQMLPRPLAGMVPIPSIKFTAYADDILVLCNSPRDFDAFFTLYQLYARAFNAKLNPGKLLAFMLAGQQPLSTIKRHLGRYQVNKWYSEADPLPLSYLGYPLLYSRNQGHSLLSKLVVSISRSTQLHNQRQLSILGRATVTNTLILSKLWHILRLVPIPLRFLAQIRSIIIRFTSRHTFPAIGYAKLLKPKYTTPPSPSPSTSKLHVSFNAAGGSLSSQTHSTTIARCSALLSCYPLLVRKNWDIVPPPVSLRRFPPSI
ncbi:hypothetical protein [Absidia glauca]|uniref:Reverse transcriptase domain-containing protein n=1 Tax=Absidia glauca TaxID=4829 RepID=A0A168S2K5_ABSGL|nr:hypothetical protein [Absidia glauca]